MMTKTPSMPSPQSVTGRIAATLRHHPDADVTDLRRELHAAKIEKYVTELAKKFPPLTEAQRERLARLIKGGAA